MTPLKNIKKYYFPIKSQKIFVNKNFLSFVQTIRFCLDQNLPKSFILNQSLSWWLFIEIVLLLINLLSLVRELGFAKQYQVSTFYQNTFSKLVMSSLLPWSGQQDLSGYFIISIRKCLKEEWNLNLSTQNAETAPAVEVVTPLQGLWRSIRYYVSSLP